MDYTIQIENKFNLGKGKMTSIKNIAINTTVGATGTTVVVGTAGVLL